MRKKPGRRVAYARIAITTLALVGFLAILTTWSMGMHMADDEHACFLAKLQNVNCATFTGFQALTFHSNAFTHFIQNAGLLGVTLLGIVFIAVLALVIGADPPIVPWLLRFETVPVLGPPPSIRKRLHWLSQFEHSPSFIFERA